MVTPTIRSVLTALPASRWAEISGDSALFVHNSADALGALEEVLTLERLLAQLSREELRRACDEHEITPKSLKKQALTEALLRAYSQDTVVKRFSTRPLGRTAPQAGDIAQVRHRQWLVVAVTEPPNTGDATRVSLVCIDDDNQGASLEVLWELELGAKVLQPEAHGLGHIQAIDPPRHFAAYLHALQWNAVTATNPKLFQAPFRAGIKLLAHQLTPLRKALLLPRANLFIADDVGLGKTIEAGLIAQELLLRQRVETLVIVCPASVCLQWRDEMQKKFGLHFEVMSRDFIAQRRQERGFAVNPWSTHARFIVSYPLLRRPEYRDPLLSHLGDRARRSLLILDEAHTAAPASAQHYAIDSKITEVVRDIAPRFENRLFLSATPHNGHSNSFSALLEILDRQRFTRGVAIRDPKRLEAVMVRRLKSDLRELGSREFPKRELVCVSVSHEGTQWTSRSRTDEQPQGPAVALGEGPEGELALARLLSEYTATTSPSKGAGKLVFINLQKRLLSSVAAFARTLDAHAERSRTQSKPKQVTLRASVLDDEDPHGPDDEALDAHDVAQIELATEALESASARSRELLAEMTTLARQRRGAPDGKALAILQWIREHQCAGVQVGGLDPKARKGDRAWSDTRVIVFTEYGDTLGYLKRLLGTAVEGSDQGDARIMTFHGGMGDESRDEVQRAFNSPPGEHPVRILLATDAAREGINLQGHCADLFHYDIPWNPARLEQRNGRIDRTLQPSPVVRCHYFAYPQRREDRVLETLVKKVDVIQRELGSLSEVLLARMSTALESGITEHTLEALSVAEKAGDRSETVASELETQRGPKAELQAELDTIATMLESSAKVMQFEPKLLRDAMDVGLELAGAKRLSRHVPSEKTAHEKIEAWELPELPEAWQETVDTLRPARGRDEPLWAFRKKPPLPIVFSPPERMNSPLAQVHLQHPLVQRILGRFLSQGFSAHDLSRVTLVKTRSPIIRVIAFGRLSLFGSGATRLHDELISVAARWFEGSDQPLKPFADEADRKAIDMLEQSLADAPTLDGLSDILQHKIAHEAPKLFAQLWPAVRDEADARAATAQRLLTQRGEDESRALTAILRAQVEDIRKRLREAPQLTLGETMEGRRAEEQLRQEKRSQEERLQAAGEELKTEPAEIAKLYHVALQRLAPVGLVVLWPETRA